MQTTNPNELDKSPTLNAYLNHHIKPSVAKRPIEK